MLLVDPVGSVDQQPVTGGGDRAAGHVVLRHTQLAHHVQHPDHVGFVVGCDRFVVVRSVVGAVTEPFHVHTADLASAGDKPEAIPFHQRCGADALHRPVVDTTSRQLLAAVLPQEFSGVLVKTEQHTQVDVRRIAAEVPAAIVGADKDFAAGHHGIAVGLRAKGGDPLDVLCPTGIPLARIAVEAANFPLAGQVLGDRHVVPARAAAPLVPLGRDSRLRLGAAAPSAAVALDVVARPGSRASVKPPHTDATPRAIPHFAICIRFLAMTVLAMTVIADQLGETVRLSTKNSACWALPNSPGLPRRFGARSVISIDHASGSASSRFHIFPCTKAESSFGATRSFSVYQTAGSSLWGFFAWVR